MKRILGIVTVLILLNSCSTDETILVHSFMNIEKSLDTQLQISEQRINKIESNSTITEIKTQSSNLIENIHYLRAEFLKLDHLNCKSSSELVAPLDHKLPTKFFLQNRGFYKLSEGIKNYKEFLSSNVNNDEVLEQIDRLLNTKSEKMSDFFVTWQSSHFEHVPLIACIINLKMIELKIRKAELLTIENHLEIEKTLANN